MITVFVNYLSSFVSGAVIFMYLGYMSQQANKSIQEVAKEGSSLVFIVYPEAISILPLPQFWSVIFFLMLITLGLDSSVCPILIHLNSLSSFSYNFGFF